MRKPRWSAACTVGALCLCIVRSVAAENISYRYDAQGRLTEVSYGDGTRTVYQRDGAGNRTSVTVASEYAPTADLGVTIHSPSSASVGRAFLIRVVTENHGPDPVVDAELVFHSSASQGAVRHVSGADCVSAGEHNTNCQLPPMPRGASIAVVFEVTPIIEGTLTSDALVSASHLDGELGNNRTRAMTEVASLSEDFHLRVGAPDPGRYGGGFGTTISAGRAVGSFESVG